MNNPYTEEYYQLINEGSRQSARAIIPLVLELIQPKSVVDVGCGLGSWLSVFMELGINECIGIDGDHIDRSMLEIPRNQFMSSDLRNPLQLDREFELVVSLEVAEHLPIECAETFVDSLTRLGPVILFSAAIPFQEGANHLNEQWPDYWAKFFLDRRYVAVDCLRKKLWQNHDVEIWYVQNILFFVRKDRLQDYPLLKKEYDSTAPDQLSIVHPKLYSKKIMGFKQWVEGLEKGRAVLQEWGSELEKQVLELEKQIAELQELKPGRIALRNVLRALPALTKHALYAKINRFLSNNNSRS